MPRSTSRLFAVTEFILKAAIVVVGIATALIAAGLVMSVLGHDLGRTTVRAGGSTIAEGRGFKLTFALAGLLALSAMVIPVLTKLLGVVRSARAGDPFTRENGARLRGIGWLLLASYAVQSLLLSGLFSSPSWVGLAATPWRGIVPVLLFFVVARIFDQGAEMRAELEGTV